MVLDEPKDDDIIKVINEIRISFEKAAYAHAENLTLDSKDGNFVLVNPNACC